MSSHATAPEHSSTVSHAPKHLRAIHPALHEADAAAEYSAVNTMQQMMNRINFTTEGMRDAT